MNAITISALAGSMAVVITAVIRFALRRARLARFKGLELRPNCLLTRYPIVFVSKQKSLFRIFDEWNDIPKYLREHGYDVMILTPVPGYALPSVLGALEELTTKCHLIAGDSHRGLLDQLASHPKVCSLTHVKSTPSPDRTRIRAEDLRPTSIETFELDRKSSRSPWEVEAKFLDFAISLAERDAGWCD